MDAAVACYREFEPCEALRPYVRAFFSFTPAASYQTTRRLTIDIRFGVNDSFCSPMFADAHGCLVFGFERACVEGQGWHCTSSPVAEAIGPTTIAAPTLPERREMIGVYFRGTGASTVLGVPGRELADRTVALDQVVRGLEAVGDDAERVDCVEAGLLRLLGKAPSTTGSMDVVGLSAWVIGRRGNVTVEEIASAAGVSRQQLTRVFLERVGVTPKLYCRLARFRAALTAVASGQSAAEIAAEFGYSDQSHMIAEFREFTSLTPGMLASGRWFHPFMGRGCQ